MLPFLSVCFDLEEARSKTSADGWTAGLAFGIDSETRCRDTDEPQPLPPPRPSWLQMGYLHVESIAHKAGGEARRRECRLADRTVMPGSM